MKIWPSMEQRSEAWFRARAGRLTASNFHRVLTPSGKDSSQWRELAIEMCCSRIRPDEIQWEGNRHTDRGEELEPEAREEFSRIMGLEVEQVGFIVQDNELVGCSPDGMIKINGQYAAGVELKCPLSKNHAEYLLDGVLRPIQGAGTRFHDCDWIALLVLHELLPASQAPDFTGGERQLYRHATRCP